LMLAGGSACWCYRAGGTKEVTCSDAKGVCYNARIVCIYKISEHATHHCCQSTSMAANSYSIVPADDIVIRSCALMCVVRTHQGERRRTGHDGPCLALDLPCERAVRWRVRDRANIWVSCRYAYLDSTDCHAFRQGVTLTSLSPLGGCQHEPQTQRKGERLRTNKIRLKCSGYLLDTLYE
jgi:hypothetical protein